MALVGFSQLKQPAAGGTTYRTDDTAALYWFDPGSIVHTGTSITSWDDKKSGGWDLTSEGTLGVPTTTTGGDYVLYTSGDVLTNSTFNIDTDGVASELVDNTGEAVIFIVAELDASGQADNTTQRYVIVQEGNASTRTYNQALHGGFYHDTNGADTTGMTSWGKAFSDAWATDNTGSTNLNATLVLLELLITQTTADHIIDGSSVGTGSVTAANLPDWTSGALRVGGMGGNGFITEGFVGKVYEIFATTNTGATHRSNIRTEIQGVYGL